MGATRLLTGLVFLIQYTAVVADSDISGFCYEDGHLHQSSPCRFFAVVIDAGSTGTRLQLYRFAHATQQHRLPFHVEEEIFREVKPGLSSFGGDPRRAGESVQQLIDHAHLHIPPKMRGKTPIALKATAGLRLLPGDMATRILEEVEAVVRASGFVVMDEESVGILRGEEEGVFSWFTLNLLLNNFYENAFGRPSDPNPRRTVPAFDLGGGSTQVTFWPTSDKIFQENPRDRYDINFFDAHMHLYTHSFLGNGLQSARLSILKVFDEDSSSLRSACFPSDFALHGWEHVLQLWNITGTSSYSFSECLREVREFVSHSRIPRLDELHDTVPHLFGYYFDRASQAGLVDRYSTSGRSSLGRVKEAAERACERVSSDLVDVPHWLPWQCLDLTYIYSLLSDGFGLSDQQKLFFAKRIRNMEVSWAQGLSYSLVNEFHERALPDILASAGANNTGPMALWSIIYERTTDVLQFFRLIS